MRAGRFRTDSRRLVWVSSYALVLNLAMFKAARASPDSVSFCFYRYSTVRDGAIEIDCWEAVSRFRNVHGKSSGQSVDF